MQETILITGSSRGIGKAIAKLANERGYKVIVHGKTDSGKLNDVHEALDGSIKTFFDISDKNAVEESVSQVLEKVGVIDVLVNNAGIAKNFLSDISEMDEESAMEEFRVNVLGTLNCIKAVLPGMVKRKSGSIVNVASIKAHPQLSTLSTLTYATTKAGVISLTKSLAKKYSEKGIRINSVSPGYVETDQVEDWSEDTFQRINEGTLLGRMAKPQEIAPLALFLASDEASYITGSDFLVDGGYMLKGK
jgi:3-oxoacyl-[acyl-carrier protein] reductase